MDVKFWALGKEGKYVQIDTSEDKIREIDYDLGGDKLQSLHGTREIDSRQFSFYGLSKLLKYETLSKEAYNSGIFKVLKMAQEYAEQHEVSDVLIQDLNIEKNHITIDISGLAQLLCHQNK